MLSGSVGRPVIIFDQRVADQYLQALAKQVDQPVIEAGLQIDGANVSAREGQAGRTVDVDATLLYLSGQQAPDNFAAASRANLMRTPIDPAQVAHTALFLAGNPCITGTTVCVDNGQHLVPLERDVMFLADPKDAS